MVVADDEVDAQAFGVSDFLHCLDAAVEHDDEFHTGLVSVVHTFVRHSVAVFVAVGDVVVDVGAVLVEEFIDECHRRDTVHIVVAVDEDALLASEGLVQAVDRRLHVLEEEGIVQLSELRAEELLGLLHGLHAPLHEQGADDGMEVQHAGQMLCTLCLFVSGLEVFPLIVHILAPLPLRYSTWPGCRREWLSC